MIGELTPRLDDRDQEVIRCNTLIAQYVRENHDLILAKNSKLRTIDGRHYNDEKHITKFSIAILISSLKRGMRAALGIKYTQTGFGDSQFDRNTGRWDREGHGRGRGRGWGRGHNGNFRGGRGGRGRGGHGGSSFHLNNNHGGPNRGFVNFREELEKFKMEIRQIISANALQE